ncbi:trypsin-like peptidase domain-containing protein [Corallococcus exiguus]|uniref:trypsin-like serine peptidase n=1 Tax=Corallococcus TaxID=83461 RepID=UPI000EE676A5|nr:MULTISPECIES: serine protease [Corallococcus]NNB91029.1 trypsin-like peptidase domain-containing protein [Corallococcus exiguus]NNB98991.1 trypsin-like peptidase domain-containing protein [Corallococcus exiguus]NNC08901.1 trypsin-like peptidase domain-containing protein [Corallococcus exiguus]NPC51664.1 trypsin-like peptidase domain-containing protein [Corallococcus exiguus]RKH78484.1 serine protease [Corallococcus sp. AB032C]
MAAKKLVGAMLVMGLTACGSVEPMDVPDAEPLASQESNVIVGTLNWVSATSLTGTQRTKSLAVGYLSIPAVGSRCTAWLVSNDVVITNNHCVGSASEAVGARVSFNYEDGIASGSRVWYACDTFIKTWSGDDMTALRCSAVNGQLPGQVYGFLTVASANAATNATVYVVNQNCDYYTTSSCVPTKKSSPGKVLNGNYSTTDISYDADTLGGSSGSPVISTSTHQVVALHHIGIGGNSQGRGTANTGVKATRVKARLAEIGL